MSGRQDAGQWDGVTAEGRALCWIHAGRHFKQLSPGMHQHRAHLADFLDRFGASYRDLLASREGRRAAAVPLDARIAATRANKTELLAVLTHPEVPLRNNPAELGTRQRVRKRDVRFGSHGDAGAQAWAIC